ncbi:hypothetical protein LPJ66_007321, partial [Kickxella alabastrina]
MGDKSRPRECAADGGAGSEGEEEHKHEQKRRKLIKSADADADADEWQIDTSGGADETLQMQRFGGSQTPSTLDGGRDTLLDSYRLETLATGRRAAPEEGEELSDSEDESETGDTVCEVSVAGDQHVALTVGRTIHVLSSGSEKQEAAAAAAVAVAVIRHEREVVCTALSEAALFVAFGDSGGTLFIVHVGSRRAVYSQALGAPLSALRFAGGGQELVLVAGARLVRFAGICMRALSEAIAQGDMARAAQAGAAISVDSVELARADGSALHAGGVGDVAVVAGSGVAVAGSGAGALSSWHAAAPGGLRLSDAVGAACTGGEGYARVQASADGRHVAALSHGGALDVYERTTLTRVFRYGAGVLGFTTVAAPGAQLRVAVLERGGGGGGGTRLSVVELPSRRVVHAMRVARRSWLARGGGGGGGGVVFVEARAGAFHVRRLSEALPLERLAHLLRGARFAEAERFAQAHGIPAAAVGRQRVAAAVAARAGVDGAEMLRLLAGVGDAGFVRDA